MKRRMNDELLSKFNQVESYHWWWEGRRRLVKDFLDDLHKKQGRLLDVGCGTGETMAFVRDNFRKWEVCGVDPSKDAVSFSRKRGFSNVRLSRADKLPFGNNRFDAMLLLDVVEHLENPEESLWEMRRVLKPGGKILVTCPALKIIWSKHDEGQGHVMRYERKEMRQLAKKSKMKLEQVKYFNFVMSFPIIAVRLLGKVPGLRFLANYDNGINYEMAKVGPVNSLLRWVFVTEVSLLKSFGYPWGISIMAVLKK